VAFLLEHSMSEMEQPGGTQDSGAAEATGAEDQNLGAEHVDDEIEGESGAASQEQTGEEETSEIEVDGKRFALPKAVAEKLTSERMMNADYTQKTQALADQRRQFEAQSAQQQKMHQEYVQDYAKVVAIDDQLARYANIDWQQAVATDPQNAILLQQEQRALEIQRAQAVQSVTQKQQQFALEQQQASAKQAQDAVAYVQREIPNWSNERDMQLLKFGQDLGLNHQELMPVLIKHPQLFKVLHQAELYSQLEKKQAAKPRPGVAAAPVTRVGAARAATPKDPSKMSDAEWYRQRQDKQRKR
jgi:hypothetical protein